MLKRKIERRLEKFYSDQRKSALLIDGARQVGINAYDPYSVVRVYVPKRGNASSLSLENSFNSGVLSVQSVFATEQEMDEKIVLVHLQL